MSWRSDFVAAARWTKDHLPAFTISTIALTALWGAIALACVTLYIWDASFYRSLAPPGMELTFQAAGIVFRTFVIFGGLAIVWMKAQKLPNAATATLRGIWVMALCACGVAAMGFVTEGNDYHQRKSTSVAETKVVTVDSADARLARIDAEKSAIRADRDRLVAGARESMRLVLSDGIAGNDDLSAFEARISQYESDANTRLAELDKQIDAIENERLTAQTSATSEQVGDPGLPAVFRFPARYIDGFDGVTFRDAFALFWVILLEMCGSVGAQSLLSVQIALSKRIKAQQAGAVGGRESAKAKMRKLIAYANEAQRSTKVDGTGEADGN